MFACICHAVSEEVIIAAAKSGSSAPQIAQATRAGTSCGMCWERLSSLVARSKICDRTGGPCTGCSRAANPTGEMPPSGNDRPVLRPRRGTTESDDSLSRRSE